MCEHLNCPGSLAYWPPGPHIDACVCEPPGVLGLLGPQGRGALAYWAPGPHSKGYIREPPGVLAVLGSRAPHKGLYLSTSRGPSRTWHQGPKYKGIFVNFTGSLGY